MFSIFNHEFMIRAFIAALLISIITPLIGNIVVFKRLSSVGDALSHAGLAGVAIGLCFSQNPVLSAVIFSVCSALLLESIRKAFPKYAEIATSVIMSLGVGIAAVASGFVQKSNDFNSFLFGSIVLIPKSELYIIIILSIVVLLVMLFLYYELLYIVFDEEGAIISGVPVKAVNFIFTVITAVTVSVSARTVGALIVSSLMVIPVACSILVSKSYRQNIILSVFFAVFFTTAGLFASFELDLKPGGTIVLIGIAALIILFPIKKYVIKER